ncbi:hypothetical protein HAX54_049837 [Datura stramonium]|uniref:Uncharacterized protein n=1 Tax=Datura stramonium TaxID=4076 RepID=A0ABS8SW63_DATST|nr:hypothetical protein [Datura stramonium]
MVDAVDGPIALLEYTSPNKESFTAFNKKGDGGFQEGDVGVHCDEPEAGATTEPTIAETVASTQAAATEQSNSYFPEVGLTTPLRIDERRSYQRRKRRERVPNDLEEIPIGEVGPDPDDITGTAATVVAPSRGRGRSRKATSTYEELTRGRGRPRKDSSTSKEVEVPARGRGRPRKVTSTFEVADAPTRGRERTTKDSSTFEAAEAPSRGRGRPTKDSSTSKVAEAPARDRGRKTKVSCISEAAETPSRGRGRPRTTHAKGMGMPRRTYITSEWFKNSTIYSAPVAPAAAQSNVVTRGPPVSSTAHVDQSCMERERTTPL